MLTHAVLNQCLNLLDETSSPLIPHGSKSSVSSLTILLVARPLSLCHIPRLSKTTHMSWYAWPYSCEFVIMQGH